MSGDPDRERLFSTLVLDHQAGLRAFIRMLGADAAAVDDLAQETFLVAYRRLDEFDRTLPAGPWLRGIARNLVANQRRSLARWARLVRPGLDEAFDGAGQTDDQAERLHLDDLVGHLRDCVERLPAHARALIAARYGADDEDSAAAAAGRNANALRQALFRVRETLRRCLSDKVGEVEL
jgi:RNA polymerase sigma-70 factor (ECF subfamily)